MAASSVRLAERGSEGDDEDLLAEIVGDLQLPAAPVFGVGRRHHRMHQAQRMRAGFVEIAYRGAAAIDQDMFGVGAVEIDFGHVPHSLRVAPCLRNTSALESGGYG